MAPKRVQRSAKSKGKTRTKTTATISVHGHGGKKQRWCNGKIWFDANGCLHIDDPGLANAIYWNYLETRKLCISFKSPDDPTKDLNVQCSC